MDGLGLELVVDTTRSNGQHLFIAVQYNGNAPAWAKLTSTLGRVAEKRRVWRSAGRRRVISVTCSLNPISNSLDDRGGGRGGGIRRVERNHKKYFSHVHDAADHFSL